MDLSSSASTTATASSANACSLVVHPLVIVNASDHFTRTHTRMTRNIQTANKYDPYGAIAGAVVGTVNSKDLSNASATGPKELSMIAIDSFECKLMKNESNELLLDVEFFKKCYSLRKDVNPNHHLLGFYLIGLTITPEQFDLLTKKIKMDLSSFCKTNILFMRVDSNKDESSSSNNNNESGIPLRAFVLNNKELFEEIPFKIDSDESERICVDYVLKQNPKLSIDPKDTIAQEHPLYSQIKSHYSTIHNSIFMLSQQIRKIREYLVQVKSGKREMNHDIIREIQALCERLPCLSDNVEVLQQELSKKYDESMLVAYLSVTMKTATQVNNLISNFTEGGVGQGKGNRLSSARASNAGFYEQTPPPLTGT